MVRLTMSTGYAGSEDLVWPDYALARTLRTLSGSMARGVGRTLSALYLQGALKTRIHRTITSPGLTCPSCDGTITLDFRPHAFIVSVNAFVLICSSMDPRDMGGYYRWYGYYVYLA